MNRPSHPASVLIADDHPGFLGEARRIVARIPRLRLVAEARDGWEALSLAKEHRPAIAFLDINMPKLDGFQAAGRILAWGLPIAVVFVTSHRDRELVKKAVELGASGYLAKEDVCDEMRACAIAVLSGNRYFSASASSSRGDQQAPLTATQRDIVNALSEGLDDADIARRLSIGLDTLRRHCARIEDKLGYPRASLRRRAGSPRGL